MTIPLATSAIALALSAALTTGTPAPEKVPAPLPTVKTVKQQVQSYFADIPIMIAIADCESHYRQFDNDASVFRGKINSLDVGVMQINERYHLSAAQEMGIDLHTVEGNLAYARHLYEREGTAPWISSSYCWNKDGNQLTYGPKNHLAANK